MERSNGMPSEEYLKRKRAYILSYQKQNYKMICIKCRLDTDSDVIEILKNSGNASEFVKAAIRAYADNRAK